MLLVALGACAGGSQGTSQGAVVKAPPAGSSVEGAVALQKGDRAAHAGEAAARTARFTLGTRRPLHGVLAVADGSEVVFSSAHGYADRERSVASALEKRFAIASLGKQITAALVMQQVDQGKLALDAPVSTYLSLGADWAKQVKVRHLLNHTSGIGKVDEPLRSAPGSTFAYSNANYDLLGKIVERVSGQSFAEVAGRLFATCGMRETAGLDTPAAAERVVGYAEQEDGSLAIASLEGMAEHVPSGGMVSSVADLIRWNLCLHEGKAVSRASYEAMIRPTTRRAHRWGELGYGFGLQVSTAEGITEFSHNGYIEGFIATLIYYPAQRRTLVALENVALDSGDMGRVFAPHDEVRAQVRAELRGSSGGAEVAAPSE
ncbi:serine hydrolase domain-containing protein [Chondromyces crocatus]|uniref:serine hydrolase domain-containing protein n=1 Tax=Chondromyces crocatus TaxID=52 RepID=UPI00147043B8|nr:serine hydrolase domain-containing protein [Chondromyces crocatus]